MDLYRMTIHQLHDLLVKKEATSKEITEAFYRRIRGIDDQIKAYLILTEEAALRQAERVDRKISRARRSATWRHSIGTEGYPLHERSADDLRLQDSGGVCPVL